MKRSARTAALLMVVLSAVGLFPPPSPAIVLTRLQTKPTFENAGIRVEYAGDPDSNAVIRVEYRRLGSQEWREGHPMIRIAGSRFATSLFGLSEGSTYEVRLLPEDPEGASVDFPQPFQITTRSSDFPAGGSDWYVDASVSASGDGSADAPFKTITEAARTARPGDVVHILPGIYSEQVTPSRSGSEEAWIHFRGEGEGVVLDGGETLPTDSGWTDEGGGVYRTLYNGSFDYANLDGVRLFHHANLDSLRNDGAGVVGGFVLRKGALYVRAPDGKPLTGRILRVAVRESGFFLSLRSYIVVENMEIRHFNTSGIELRNSHHIAVRRCRVHHARQMIQIEGRKSADNLIEDCRIWGTAVTGWPWETCHHGHDCGSNAVSLYDAGEGNVIRRNECRSVYNGIYLGQWTEDYPEENALENDVYDNRLEEIVDDGLEPECHAINLRLYGNHFKKVFSPISLAPIETGPTWVMRNVIDGLWPDSPGTHRWRHSPGWVKISLTPRGTLPLGALRIYHNTALIRGPDQNGWSAPGSGNTHFVNNVVSATRYVFEDWGDWPYPSGNVWDYNNLYTTDPERYVKWDGARLDLAGFQALGFQVHGLAEPPHFADPDAGDLSLRGDDPGIDHGLYLPGINDEYCGKAPDLGAYEYCGDASTSVDGDLGLAQSQRFRLAPAYPNPFNSAAVVPYELDVPSQVDLSVYNLSGQKVATLVEGWQRAGRHAVVWNGRDRRGEPQASGLYLCRLQVERGMLTRKLVLLK